MVRLVFRPYTQIRRSICTSEPLRASTRVSSGFTLFRHSSPSFGSQQLCSYSNPSEDIRIGRWCTLKSSHLRSLSLRVRVLHPNTRIDVRLLGPCFKTGGLRSLCQHPSQRRSPRSRQAVSTKAITLHRSRDTFLNHYPTIQTDAGPVSCGEPNQEGKDRKIPSLISSPSLSTISRTFSLSFQSSFHLSITVLVRYRSLANI